MDLSYFLKGIIVGLIIAAPVGPIGVMCLYRTLTVGRRYGVISGLGAATADALYGSVAVFGVSFVSRLLINEQVWFRLFGGLIFIFIGLKILSANQTHQARSTGKSLIGAYLSAFLLTLTNPATILVFAAIFAAMGIVCSHGDLILEGELIAGIFFGSSLWWLIVGSGIHLFQVRLNPVWLNRTKKIFGAILMGLGILMFFSLAK